MGCIADLRRSLPTDGKWRALVDLACECLEPDPARRPTARAARDRLREQSIDKQLARLLDTVAQLTREKEEWQLQMTLAVRAERERGVKELETAVQAERVRLTQEKDAAVLAAIMRTTQEKDVLLQAERMRMTKDKDAAVLQERQRHVVLSQIEKHAPPLHRPQHAQEQAADAAFVSERQHLMVLQQIHQHTHSPQPEPQHLLLPQQHTHQRPHSPQPEPLRPVVVIPHSHPHPHSQPHALMRPEPSRPVVVIPQPQPQPYHPVVVVRSPLHHVQPPSSSPSAQHFPSQHPVVVVLFFSHFSKSLYLVTQVSNSHDTQENQGFCRPSTS
jgi:hypothetical protein